MTPSRARPRLLLLAALLLPCLVVAALGARTLAQERELAQRRAADRRSLLGNQLGAWMIAELQELRRAVEATGVAGGGRPEVAVMMPIEEGEVRPPWKDEAERARREHFADFVGEVGIRRAERAEQEDPERAIPIYEDLLRSLSTGTSTASAGEVMYVRLVLARALRSAGRIDEAQRHELAVVEHSPPALDEFGVPLAVYAVQRLAADGHTEVVQPTLEALLEETEWHSPVALYAMGELIADHPVGGRAAAELAERTDRAERVVALARNLQVWTDRPGSVRSGRRWRVQGEPPWLLGRVDGAGGVPPLVFAVRAERLLGDLSTVEGAPEVRDVRLSTSPGPGTVPLHPELPSLQAAFEIPVDPPEARRARWQLAFFGTSVGLVVGLSAIAAWLLWRDVRREMRLASLRSSFVAHVSHEFRTPLAAIRMFADLLRAKSRSRPERDYVETIAGESERLSRLVENVLDFARVEP
ncbi:MAG: histidine kinase dimerization/phospho-acceptor domain-containing protein, partial [Gemmatimonadota bacterium]|nr:histidine kinase dimerization/phospho-acceptor domain-containing protein [Gemmatimonadota bacterium]